MNDNIYKNSLLLLLTFGISQQMGMNSHLLNNLAAGLFILPFFIFSALGGQLADKYDKAFLIRKIKGLEVIIMSLAGICFFLNFYWGLLALLFFMGMQSALFGPVKYAILPQNLSAKELVAGNAWVELGTFMAILLGTLAAGILVTWGQAFSVALAVIVLAVVGWLASLAIPITKAENPKLIVNFNFFSSTWDLLKYAYQDKNIWLTLWAISWFWFLGASYLTQFPTYARDFLYADAQVVTLLLAMFSIGVAIGSLLCEKLSYARLELGMVPLGSLLITLGGLGLISVHIEVSTTLTQLTHFLTERYAWQVIVSLLILGIGGGLYIVPLYTLLQQRSARDHRARIIAANNVVNALMMVFSALAGIFFLVMLEWNLAEFWMLLACINILVAAIIYTYIPEFTLRCVIWLTCHLLYRVRVNNIQHLPDEGPVLVICNHVSYIDALLLGGMIRRPVRFVMDKPIYQIKALNWFFRLAQAIPIASERHDPQGLRKAFAQIDMALAAGELVLIFPEGRLTPNGQLQPFKAGVLRILRQRSVPVVPMALQGLWGSWFSRSGGMAFRKWPKRLRAPVTLNVGDPIMQVTEMQVLQQQVEHLLRQEIN
ncbi:MFS transporter [Allopseudospirillum japonicum]|nr:MFS transporter [Allopseudospirillum japonicum]